ncbi:hypothetical protein [Myxacorys almedinensis]|uniref:RAMP superfamily protein n=1 Tax=Myxacorys almedinensis A TaxID=2690445 RepID=A0A8J8CJV6_9CYAN|nr:hypothetical protein [Myxacorys almedinensis]NDJ17976.1 hypothetical protein [Myxacorys almedinensis A]
MSDHDYVPLMFQAQVEERSQIQRLIPSQKAEQQAYDWAQQWQEACDRKTVPTFEAHVQTREHRFTWRMVTNSGQDAGVIRPVIGERGWAYFPGSSMKGAFLRACRQLCPLDVLRFCGGKGKDGELQPGLLRFHGGYPKDAKWLDDSLVDVVHPQEDWQLNGQKNNGAFIQISLYQPTFVFGISSNKVLSSTEWATIWQIWEQAIGRGIGSRVSAGYGQTRNHGESNLLTVRLCGEGIASQRIDKTGEFRPNVFKAALRGHTHRLLSGIVDEATAERFTKELWGGFLGRDGAIAGKLGTAFNAPDLELRDQYRASVYDTGEATLNLLVMQDVSEQQRKNLKILLTQIIKFSLLLGGFGKSWRRTDHRLFFPKYLEDSHKCMIGCHWELLEKSLSFCVPVKQLSDVTRFLDGLQGKIAGFPMLKDLSPRPPDVTMKETWRKENVEVWGRIAEDEDDSVAVRWFHGAYHGQNSIYRSDLTGKMGQIGRMWHRMYPRYLPPLAEKTPPRKTEQFVELLTIFPNRSGNPDEVSKTQDFLKFLRDNSDFEKLW